MQRRHLNTIGCVASLLAGALAVAIACGAAITFAVFGFQSAPSVDPTRTPRPPTLTFTPLPSPIPTATDTPVPTVTPIYTPSASERAAVLLADVDAPWSRGDWPQVIELLKQALNLDSSNQDVKQKLYVAYYNLGRSLLAQGRKAEAIVQFQSALQVNPNGAEAQQELLNLTPTPTKAPTKIPTQTPTIVPTAAPINTTAPTNPCSVEVIIVSNVDHDLGLYLDGARMYYFEPYNYRLFGVCPGFHTIRVSNSSWAPRGFSLYVQAGYDLQKFAAYFQ